MILPPDLTAPVPGNASPAAEGRPRQRYRDLRTSLLLGVCCLLVYNANLRSIGTGDTLPARYLPFGIWRYGSVLLNPIRDVTIEGHSDPYWIVDGRAGRALSLYPVVLPLLVSPLYLPAIGYLHFEGWTEWRLRQVATVMEKVTSSLLAASAAALRCLLFRLPTPPAAFFRCGLLNGVAGLLVSPPRGLFVFSPFLLLVPAALRHGLRDRATRTLTLAIGAAALAQILFYAKADWRAGYSWGPRWLTDLLPFLVWLLPPGLAALRGARRRAFVFATGPSVAIQALGAFWYLG